MNSDKLLGRTDEEISGSISGTPQHLSTIQGEEACIYTSEVRIFPQPLPENVVWRVDFSRVQEAKGLRSVSSKGGCEQVAVADDRGKLEWNSVLFQANSHFETIEIEKERM
ncbi:hypothetical protein TNCT_711591 [Trichonephila clavata]|uniref:Uncharacterized protein n=1 Tax=Trichonephila clavata TaxID=2740835 RepID=A0A8X6FTS7_TRICU|nr:hypothetical protein TNCT_711591 [Trichonephila clavata]